VLNVEDQAEKDSEAQSLAFRSEALGVSGGALGPDIPAFVTGGVRLVYDQVVG
jgi:hypothetical protein